MVPLVVGGLPQLQYVASRKRRFTSLESDDVEHPITGSGSLKLIRDDFVRTDLCPEVTDNAGWVEMEGFNPVFWRVPCHESDFLFVDGDFVVDT
jgi:hypothetical protein